jgi:tetratricopeptide (TPR) repeat protein
VNKPTIFISYSHKDEAWKDRVVTHLSVLQQYELWDDRRIAGGDDWFRAITEAIERGQIALLLVSANSLTSDFILKEEVPRLLAKRDAGQLRLYPIIVEPCHWAAVEWLKRMNLRPCDGRPLGETKNKERTDHQINRDLAEIAMEISQAANEINEIKPYRLKNSGKLILPPQPPHPESQVCPYRGLEFFREEDRKFFFGRTTCAEQLLKKVSEDLLPLIALVGSSGSGKSSVVQAGLLPLLRELTRPRWNVAIFTPGTSPLRAMAMALVRVEGPKLDTLNFQRRAIKLGEDLVNGEISLAEAIKRMVGQSNGTERLLLIVDQFEELFRETPESVRRPFVESLIEATQTAPATVLLTLRADFYGQAISIGELSDRIQQGIVNLRPLYLAELQAVIEEPAKLVGLQFQEGLVQRILQDVESQPDSLPLLEDALTELCNRKQGNLITHAQYDAIGGLEEAISRRADDALASLPYEQQEIALRALTRLVRVSIEDDEGADTRRCVRLTELDEVSREALFRLVDARLLVTKRNDVTGEETIEVAHEALIRHWIRLKEVLANHREFLIWKRRLEFRMKEWERQRRDDGALLKGASLTEAKRWLAERAADISQDEQDFINWGESHHYQIEQVLRKGLDLVKNANSKHLPVQKWFCALALCGKLDLALNAARGMENRAHRSSTLLAIAKELIRTGLVDNARNVLHEALDNVRAINGNTRNIALSEIAQSFANIRVADRAINITTKIRNSKLRIYTYYSIANSLAKLGLAEEALIAAHNLEDVDKQDMAFSTIAEVLVQNGAIEQSLDAARSIRSDDKRSHALCSIAGTCSNTGLFEQALIVATEIESDQHRANALSHILQGIVTSGLSHQAGQILTDSHQVALSITSPYHRSLALAKIGETLIEMGIEMIPHRQVLVTALSSTRDIENIYQRAEALSEISAIFTKGGVDQEARPVLIATLGAARRIGDNYQRAQALSSIADALAKFGLARKARETFDEARTTACNITNRDQRDQILTSIAVKLAQLGFIEQAFDTCKLIKRDSYRIKAFTTLAETLIQAGIADQALAATRKIGYHAQAFSIVAKSFAKAGFFEQSLVVADLIKDIDQRVQTLSYITNRLIRNGSTDKARDVMLKALMLTSRAKDVRDRVQILSGISETLAKAGLARNARQELIEVYVTVRWVEDRDQLAKTLIVIAEALAKAGISDEQAISIAKEARYAVGGIVSDFVRSREGVRLVRVLAKLKLYQIALETADLCTRMNDRLDAYTAIVSEYYST